MWTGRQTLSSIESAIAKLHGEEGQLDGALRSAVGDAERLRKERSQALRELARIKLDEMTAGRLVEQSRRRRAPRRADPRRLSHAHRGRHRAARGASEGGGGRAGRAPHRRRRGGEPRWRQSRACARRPKQACRRRRNGATPRRARDAAEAVAAEAEKKADASEAELGAKQKPYDDDALFAYLWRRRFGRRESMPAPASRKPSIAWWRSSSASAMRAPTTRR